MSSVKGQPIKAGGQYPNVNPMEFHKLLAHLGLDPAGVSSPVIPLSGVAVNRRDYAEGAEGAKVYYTDAALLKMLSCWPAKAVVVDFDAWQNAFCHWMVVKGVYETPESMDMDGRVGMVRQRGPVSRATHILARQPQGGGVDGYSVRPLVIENLNEPGRRVNLRRALLLPTLERYNGSAESLERMKSILKPRQERPGEGIFGADVARAVEACPASREVELPAPAGGVIEEAASGKSLPDPRRAVMVKDASRAGAADIKVYDGAGRLPVKAGAAAVEPAGKPIPAWCATVPYLALPSGARVMAKEHVDAAVKLKVGAVIDGMLHELSEHGIIVR
jgi:hypothetical protein